MPHLGCGRFRAGRSSHSHHPKGSRTVGGFWNQRPCPCGWGPSRVAEDTSRRAVGWRGAGRRGCGLGGASCPVLSLLPSWCRALAVAVPRCRLVPGGRWWVLRCGPVLPGGGCGGRPGRSPASWWWRVLSRCLPRLPLLRRGAGGVAVLAASAGSVVVSSGSRCRLPRWPPAGVWCLPLCRRLLRGAGPDLRRAGAGFRACSSLLPSEPCPPWQDRPLPAG